MKGLQLIRQLATASSSGSSGLVNPPIALFGTSGRYCNALYSAAHKQKQLDAVEADLKRLQQLAENDGKFKEFLQNPLLSITEKKGILQRLSGEKLRLNPITLNALDLMAENRRLSILPQLARDFGRVMSTVRGEVNCIVYTVQPVTDANVRKQIEDSLRGFTSKKLSIQLKVDPTIVGGLVVDFGDSYIDLSIRSKLKAYTDILKQAV